MNVHLTWRKSTKSDSEGGACVELAALLTAVAVRDSKHPTAPHLVLKRTTLRALAQGVNATL